MIPAIQEINFPSYATLHQATVSFTEMGERTISTQVRIDGDVVPDFTGWELSFKGERFILNTKDPQAVKDNSTRNSLVDLTFVSWPVNELKRYFFFEPTSIDASTAIADKYVASVNLPVEDFAALFNKVLKYYFGDKVVFSLYMSGQGQYSTDRALVEINYTYIWDVLVKFFEIYGVRWRIEYDESDDVYTIKAGWPTTDIDINDHDFEYGYKGGLVRFERQVQDVDIHNILLGRGGEKNIPYRYFKRVDPQNPDWAADPDAIPELANIYFDRLRDINFRWYVRGWMQNPNHDTSWEDGGYVYPTYTITSDSPYYFAYQKGRTDEKFNPVEYVKDDESIADYGEHWGALDDNDDIFPTIQSVSRDPLGRIDETVAVSEIVTDDISAMAQNAAVEKSINRLSVSLNGETRTEFDLQSEEFTIPSGSTGNITYVPFGTDNTYPGLVRFDTDNSTVVAVSDGVEYPIDAIPAGTYRLKLHMVIARSGQATSATGTFGIENIILTTSTQETDAWKPTFDIWVKNIWGTEKQDGETDVQYAERVWLPILGDRVGNEAKIVFSTGFMSVSEDYEFPIVSYPVHDTSKSINGVPSEWRITLRKSDAEFDATGLYIPNASTGGKPVAGDKFFFIGIDMPFQYVTLAEEDLNTYKSAQLDTESAISPTWIMNLDKVRVHSLEDEEYGRTLADRLAAGGKVWIKDKRFTPGKRLQLYVQSITYTWNEPTVESPYIVPDIEVVLSDKVVAVDSVVQRIQNDVSSIKNQYARISDVEAVVRSVAEPIFLKKTGESDSSDSPTQFSSKVTSKGFRQGGVGGSGWGIYRDNTSVWAEAEAEAATRTRGLLRAVAEERNTEGDTVFEADRIVVRKELQVNSLVINQISYLGGKEIISAAKIEVSKVIETDNGYVCYFDQRRNSVANNFVVNDIAMGQVFDPYNAELRYYKALVTAVDIDSITISKTQKVGSGIPRVGDVIVQYGNTTQSGRQYVIVRDVVGGGYERMLSGLNSLNADGDEYYFAGRESSGTGPRWFVGSHEQDGDYAEYENGVLTIKANVVFKAGQTIPGLSDLTDDVEALKYLKTALPKSDTIITGGLILSKVIALRDANNNIMSGINGDTSLSNIAAWYGGPMADKEASPTPASYAKSLFRFDGSGYLAGGNIHWNNQGYGGIPGITWSNDGTSDVVTIGANVRLASVDGDTVTDLLNAVNELTDLFEIVNGNIHVKNNRGFYSDSFISAGGLSDGGGSAGGNAVLQAQTYGGTLSATGINPINFYSKEKVDQLIATAGTVQTVAGVSPISGDVPVASLQTALGFSNYYTKTQVDSLIGAINQFHYEIYASLPSSGQGNVLYLIGPTGSGADKYEEYVYANNTWTKIGDTTLDLSGYMLSSSFTAANIKATLGNTAVNRATADASGNTITTTYATITALNGVSGRVATLEGRTNWDTYFGVDENGDIYVKKNGNTARNFYSWGAVSAGGLSSGGGSEGASLAAVWASLKTNSDEYANEKINAYHIPIGSGLSVVNGLIVANNAGTVTSVKVGTTTYNPTDGVVSLPAYPTSLPASDVYSWAKAETKPSYAFSEITGTASTSQIPTLAISKISGLQDALDGKQPLDADLTAIAGLTGTSGFLKKTAANTWALDTNTYLTGITSTMVTNALGYTPADNAALANYLPLTGGTLKNAIREILTLNQETSSTGVTGAYIRFSTNGASKAAIGYNSNLGTFLENSTIEGLPYVNIDNSGVFKYKNTHVFWHAGNSNLTTVNWAANQMTAQSFKLSAGAPTITWDATNSAWHLSGNFYADGWISAGGVSSGGGASGIDLAAMWASLTNSISDAYAATKIAPAHIPDMSGTYGYLKSGDISGVYLPLTGGTLKNSTREILALNQETSSTGVTGAYIRFSTNGEPKAGVGYNSNLGTILENASVAGVPYVNIDNSGVFKYKNTYTFLHSGNYATWINTTNFPGLNGNQTITLSGDVSGSGATSISVSIGQGKVTNAMLAGSIANGKLANSSITINGSSTSLGGSFNTASITAGTAGQSTASSGVSFSIPYVTMNAYGIVTGYGTHTHTISAQNLYDTIGDTKYAPYHAAGYVKKDGDTMTSFTRDVLALNQNTTSTGVVGPYLGFQVNGTSVAGVGSDSSVGVYLENDNATGHPYVNLDNNGVFKYNNTYTFWHSGNSNLSTVNWAANQITANVGKFTTSTDKQVLIESGQSGANIAFYSTAFHAGSINASTLFLNSQSGGDVVIGTASPSGTARLHVSGTTVHPLRLQSTASECSMVFAPSGNTGNNGTHAIGSYMNGSAPAFFVYDAALNTQAIHIEGGKIGLWTTSPTAKLTVMNAADPGSAGHTIAEFLSYSPNPYGFVFRGFASGAHAIQVEREGTSSEFFPLVLQHRGGNVGIGTPTPSQKLHVVGNIVATGAITAGAASDARLKTNIRALSAEAAKRIVMGLNPVTFTWNEKATELYDRYKGDDLGMIAQEVEPYLPQAVGTIFESYKRLDYTKIISPLVKVAQDHESRIRQLEAENAELRKRLNMN